MVKTRKNNRKTFYKKHYMKSCKSRKYKSIYGSNRSPVALFF